MMYGLCLNDAQGGTCGRKGSPALFPRGSLTSAAATAAVEADRPIHYDPGSVECGEVSPVALTGRTVRRMFQSQALRLAMLTLVLPTLLAAPAQAGMLLLHRHCDESTHFHRFHYADGDAWRDDHAEQHPCDGAGHHHGDHPGHHEPDDPGAAAVDGDCEHDTPILVLTKEHLNRPVRAGGSATISSTCAMLPAVAGLLAATEHDMIGVPPPTGSPHAGPAKQDATAALLMRNHALLL